MSRRKQLGQEKIPVIEGSVVAQSRAKPISMLRVTGWLRVTDLCLVGFTGIATGWAWGASRSDLTGFPRTVLVLIGILSAAIMLEFLRVYDPRSLLRLRLHIGPAVLALSLALSLIFLDDLVLADYDSLFQPSWIASWLVTAGFGLAGTRIALKQWLRQAILEERVARRTIIVGAGDIGHRLATHLGRAPDPRICIVGFIDDRRSRIPQTVCGLPVLGTVEALVELIRRDMVDEVILALPWMAEQRVRELVYQLAVTPVRISLCPDLAGFHFIDRGFTDLGGLPVLHVIDRPISGVSYLIKLLEDWVLAILLLVALMPVFLVIAVAIRLDTPGPVFFKQKRLGFNEAVFEVWKFRTLHHDLADSDGDTLIIRNDRRVTRVGAVLRRVSLDELPQLINVLKGDMSIVGPRPHPLKAKAEGKLYWDAVASYSARHRVKPGITGWAQVNGWRGETDSVEKISKRVEYDIEYINNWSIWFDLKILLKTGFVLLIDKHAY